MRFVVEARSQVREGRVERMLVVLRTAGEVVLRMEEREIRIAVVGEVAHNLAVVGDMLVVRIDLLEEHHMAAAEGVARTEVVEVDIVADRTELGERRKLAAGEDIPGEGIGLGVVGHKLAVEEGDIARTAVEGNLFIVSAGHGPNRMYSRP